MTSLSPPTAASGSAPAIDDSPLTGFHRRLAFYSCGGPFCDGYILGIIAIALAPLSADIGLSTRWQGAIAAAALVGMFVGGALFGYLTDLVGRQLMYTLDLSLFVVASAAQFFVHDPVLLFALRFILGLAIGADYPIASALMVEFAPKRHRGMLLSVMIGAWWLGYTCSFVIGALMAHAGWSWRAMLASSAVPAALVLFMRWGTPESPRWLVSKGRLDEAREIVEKHLGSEVVLDESPPTRTSYRRVFQGIYGRRTLFVSVFWACQVIPAFGIDTYAPDLLRTLGASDPNLGAAILSLFFLAGVVPAMFLIDRIGRRPLLTIPFLVTAITLAVLAFAGHNALIAAVAFVVFAIFSAGSSVLQWVYPSELFPTDVRATALGFATAMSRIGAAAGTFLVPIALARIGITWLMIAFAAVCLAGWIVSLWLAPETRGLSLVEASA